MARRRVPPPEATSELEMPERLRRCIVEDWVEPTEMPRWVDREINGVPTGTDAVAWSLLFLARRRYKDAVAEWVAAGGARPSYGRPVFRDEEAFVARVPVRRPP